MYSKCLFSRRETSYSRPARVVDQVYSPRIRPEVSGLSVSTMLGILRSLQMATGSHLANYAVETGTFGSATWITVKCTDSPMPRATISSLPGPRTRRLWSMQVTAGEPFGLQRSVGDASFVECMPPTPYILLQEHRVE